MNRLLITVWITGILITGLTGIAGGQTVKATATLDSVRILIGDQVNLILEIEKPAGLRVNFPEIPDSLAGKIEVLNRSAIDTLKLKNDNLKLVRKLLITCFDSGVYRIPPFRFDVSDFGKNDSIFTNWLSLQVLTLEIDTTRGPVDIKLPYEAPLTLKEVTPYILGIILAGAILFLLLYSIKRKKKKLPLFTLPAKPKEPAHVIALRELDRIREEKIWQKDKIKQYYTEVTEVLRIYIEERFGIPAMEQTSTEILGSFRIKPETVEEKSLKYLEHILPLADLVKFAKYYPLPDDHNIVLANAYLFVNNTKIEEIRKPAEAAEDTEGNAEQEETPKTDV